VATPRTGRPRGRPRKPEEPQPKRDRGRLPLPLAVDLERYFLALLSAHIEIGKLNGTSEAVTLKTFADLEDVRGGAAWRGHIDNRIRE
jgi:hypothetical protein